METTIRHVQWVASHAGLTNHFPSVAAEIAAVLAVSTIVRVVTVSSAPFTIAVTSSCQEVAFIARMVALVADRTDAATVVLT